MRADLTVFWKNNARAYELFADLLARAERGAYDDEFLKQLAAYREESPESERADIFAAQYLLHYGDAEGAAVCGERAYARRPVNYEVWKVLAKAYRGLGRAMESITMQGYAYGLYQAPPLQINLTEESLQEELGRLSMAVGWGNYAPITKRRAVIENSQMSFRPDIFVGEHLPLTMPTGSARFWVGIYTESRFLSEPSYMISAVRHCDAFMDYGHRDFFFDLHKARECQGTTQIHVPKGQELLISLAGTEETEQKITLQTSHSKTAFYLGKWAFSYFRLSEDTTLHAESDTSYAVGTPIYLGHHPQRKKLVLNILFDALSWSVVRTRFPACMPHIASFFTKGLIFGQTFSTSEHTYPAHPAIETGRYPQHTHLFNERDSHELFPDCVTLAESMKRLGYYCSAPMASNNGIYCGLMRGYDRITMASWPPLRGWNVPSVILMPLTKLINFFFSTSQMYIHFMRRGSNSSHLSRHRSRSLGAALILNSLWQVCVCQTTNYIKHSFGGSCAMPTVIWDSCSPISKKPMQKTNILSISIPIMGYRSFLLPSKKEMLTSLESIPREPHGCSAAQGSRKALSRMNSRVLQTSIQRWGIYAASR